MLSYKSHHSMVVLPKSCSKAASVIVPDEFLLLLNPLTNVCVGAKRTVTNRCLPIAIYEYTA
jgi:hypothetical protein